MLIDAHTHVWRALPAGAACAPTVVDAHCDVPQTLLAAYLDEHGVDAAVLVQPMDRGYDNSYVVDCAAAEPGRFASVSVVDPRGPAAAERLAYWVEERSARGLRMRPRFRDEAAVFGSAATFPLWVEADRLGIPVNVLADASHLDSLASLAERFPGVPVLLDHLGHPDAGRGLDTREFQQLLGLSRLANVSIKLSGYYHFDDDAYPYRRCAEMVHAVYDRFGPSRLIWGSDFPHVLLKSGYPNSLNWLERACPFINATDRRQILGENARRLYWPASPTVSHTP